MSNVNLHIENCNLVITMLRQAGGLKVCNVKTLKNIVKSLPSIPKVANERGVSYWQDDTADKWISAEHARIVERLVAQGQTDKSLALGHLIDSIIKRIESTCQNLEESDFDSIAGGRQEGNLKINVPCLTAKTTGEAWQELQAYTLGNLLDLSEAQDYAKVLRYVATRLRAKAKELEPAESE